MFIPFSHQLLDGRIRSTCSTAALIDQAIDENTALLQQRGEAIDASLLRRIVRCHLHELASQAGELGAAGQRLVAEDCIAADHVAAHSGFHLCATAREGVLGLQNLEGVIHPFGVAIQGRDVAVGDCGERHE